MDTEPGSEFAPDKAGPARPVWRREWRSALVVAAAVAASGVPLGLLWYAIAPRVPLVMIGTTPYPVDPEPEGYIADDGWFFFIGLGAGVLAAIAVWILARRHRGPAMLAAVTVGGVAAGLLAAWLGNRFGLGTYLKLSAHAAPGTKFSRPVAIPSAQLRAWPPRADGPVLAQALAGAAIYTLLASFHPSPDLDAEVARPALPEWPVVSSDWTAPQAPSTAPEPPEPGPGSPPRG